MEKCEFPIETPKILRRARDDIALGWSAAFIILPGVAGRLRARGKG